MINSVKLNPTFEVNEVHISKVIATEWKNFGSDLVRLVECLPSGFTHTHERTHTHTHTNAHSNTHTNAHRHTHRKKGRMMLPGNIFESYYVIVMPSS